jgi:hypothetical protein
VIFNYKTNNKKSKEHVKKQEKDGSPETHARQLFYFKINNFLGVNDINL